MLRERALLACSSVGDYEQGALGKPLLIPPSPSPIGPTYTMGGRLSPGGVMASCWSFAREAAKPMSARSAASS